jgi:hypothetical protein
VTRQRLEGSQGGYYSELAIAKWRIALMENWIDIGSADELSATKMSSQGVLRLLPLLTLHNTWQPLQSLEDKERSQSIEASS